MSSLLDKLNNGETTLSNPNPTVNTLSQDNSALEGTAPDRINTKTPLRPSKLRETAPNYTFTKYEDVAPEGRTF